MRLEGLKIGLIEDDPIMGESLQQAFELEGAEVVWWQTGAEALAALPHSNRDIIVCDIRLPDMNGEQVFEQASRYRTASPFLFMTAYGDVEQAVRLLKKGGGDYVTKPFELEGIIQRITALVPVQELRKTKKMLGVSDAMLEIERTLKRISNSRMPVLLVGETGVGKEVCARFLHGLATDDLEPFVAVNCAAIPEASVEFELFGSSSPELHHGYVERAQRGTLFLDGIADLSLGIQPKLLRLLEEETIYRLGGETPIHFDARVICSTSLNLKKLVEEGMFREDLLYRINAITIEIPPLRERTEDIIWLAEMFLNDVAALAGGEVKKLSAAAKERLVEHSWPGNARELRNRIEKAHSLVLTRRISPENLFSDRSGESSFENKIAKLSVVRDAAERRQIKLALDAEDGNVSKAAKTLGISRTTMWEKMLKHGISSHLDG